MQTVIPISKALSVYPSNKPQNKIFHPPTVRDSLYSLPFSLQAISTSPLEQPYTPISVSLPCLFDLRRIQSSASYTTTIHNIHKLYQSINGIDSEEIRIRNHTDQPTCAIILFSPGLDHSDVILRLLACDETRSNAKGLL